MKLDFSKFNRQKEGAKKWANAKAYGSSKNGCGTLWYVTGFGKTFTALNHIVNPYLKKDGTRTIIILTCRDTHFRQWKDRIPKYVDEQQDAITVFTVQYCIQNELKLQCDLLIVDEVHMFYDDIYFSFINGINIKYRHILTLTATFKDPNNRHLKLESIAPVIDHITEKEALSNGWISRYIEYNLGIKFANEETIEYIRLSDIISENTSKFGNDRPLAIAQKCLSGGEYGGIHYDGIKFAKRLAILRGWHENLNLLDHKDKEINDTWNPNVIIGYAKKLMQAIRARKNLIYNAENKFKVIIELVKKFNKLKTMCFSESTKFANELCNSLNEIEENSTVVYHSQLESRPLKDKNGKWFIYGKTAKRAGQKKIFGKKKLKEFYTNKFIDNEVRILSTARSLDSGFDCEDIKMAIISSRSSNFNQQTQRGGRVKRVIPEKPNAIMLLINIYIMNTKDFDYLKSAQSQSTNKIHWVTSIDEIEFEPNSNSFDLDQL